MHICVYIYIYIHTCIVALLLSLFILFEFTLLRVSNIVYAHTMFAHVWHSSRSTAALLI